MRIPSDAIGARASGTWIRQNRSQVLAPSTLAASEISLGMFTKWARIQNTANGMNSPISGSTIANRVLRMPICRARKYSGVMIPSKGRVSPKMKSRSRYLAPGIRSRPIANPPWSRSRGRAGTTASTMNTLEARSARMFATLNASTKLPHCGSAGHDRPLGTRAGWVQRGGEDAQERQDRDRASAR